jgi:hypothetical protein
MTGYAALQGGVYRSQVTILSRLYKSNAGAYRNFAAQSFNVKASQSHSIHDVIISGTGAVGLFPACGLAMVIRPMQVFH